MIALTPSMTLAIAGVFIVLSSVAAVGAGNAPALPGPYQSIPLRSQGAVFVQPQTTQQNHNNFVQANQRPTTATFPTHNFPMPYWMQANPANGQQVTNQPVTSAQNPRPSQFQQASSNNGSRGYNPNNQGYVQQLSSEFFPGYGAGFGAGFFRTNPGANVPQGYQNNQGYQYYTAPAPVNPAQGNFAPASNWGVQWNGFGNGQVANPWGGYGYLPPNGSNNRWPIGNPNMMQR